MNGLGEQIAVLDGLSALDPNDGRLGQQRARVDEYARAVMPGVLSRMNVLDASGGGNYSGGGAYVPGLPLLPSTVGLAGLRGFRGLRGVPSVLPNKMNVIDPGGGALYTGGSSWTPGMPLIASSSGLAAAIIDGGYGRAGLGAPLINGGYGRAGLGTTLTAVDEDLAGAAEAMEVGRKIDANDGRLGQRPAAVDEYGRPIMPGVLARSNVLDPSEGANYSGGSSYAPGVPLIASTIGLAGLAGRIRDLDGLADDAIGMPPALKKVAGRARVAQLKGKVQAIAKNAARMSPNQKAQARVAINKIGNDLNTVRKIRTIVAQRTMANAQPTNQGRFANMSPLWAS